MEALSATEAKHSRLSSQQAPALQATAATPAAPPAVMKTMIQLTVVTVLTADASMPRLLHQQTLMSTRLISHRFTLSAGGVEKAGMTQTATSARSMHPVSMPPEVADTLQGSRSKASGQALPIVTQPCCQPPCRLTLLALLSAHSCLAWGTMPPPSSLAKLHRLPLHINLDYLSGPSQETPGWRAQCMTDLQQPHLHR